MKYLQNKFYDELDNYFKIFDSNKVGSIETAKNNIKYLQSIVADMLEWLRDYKFESADAEIYFFKFQKPRVFSKLIYYNNIIEIESSIPISKKVQKKYLLDKTKYYTKLNDKNNMLIIYYRTKKTDLDIKFFTRKSKSKKIIFIENYISNFDCLVNTSKDTELSIFLAYDAIIQYLEDRIENLKIKTTEISETQPFLNWTGNKIELIELIYALHLSKAINFGNSDIKEIANKIGVFFNLEIDEYIYRSFIDIKNRKMETTKFLNQLQITLATYIKEQDK